MPAVSMTTRRPTTRYFRGHQPQACVFEAAEVYGEDHAGANIDEDDLLAYDDFDHEMLDFGYDEDQMMALTMEQKGFKTRDEYDRWLDDGVEEYEERRYARLLLETEADD